MAAPTIVPPAYEDVPPTMWPGIRSRTSIARIGPTTAVPMPIPKVARSNVAVLGATARATPDVTRTVTLRVMPCRVPNQPATDGPTSANTPMHRTGIVVSSPTNACDTPRSSMISGTSGPMADSCGRRARATTNRAATSGAEAGA
jgi:hypothetical protein